MFSLRVIGSTNETHREIKIAYFGSRAKDLFCLFFAFPIQHIFCCTETEWDDPLMGEWQPWLVRICLKLLSHLTISRFALEPNTTACHIQNLISLFLPLSLFFTLSFVVDFSPLVCLFGLILIHVRWLYTLWGSQLWMGLCMKATTSCLQHQNKLKWQR